jgi:hypothetical protein
MGWEAGTYMGFSHEATWTETQKIFLFFLFFFFFLTIEFTGFRRLLRGAFGKCFWKWSCALSRFAVSKLNFVSRGALIWGCGKTLDLDRPESLLSEIFNQPLPMNWIKWADNVNQEMRRCGYMDMEVIFSECSDEDEKLLLQVHRINSLVLKVNQGLIYCKGNHFHVKDLEKRGNWASSNLQARREGGN